MFVPSHALAGFESFFQLILGLNGTERHLKSAGQERGTVIVGKRKRLLLTQIKFSVGRIVTYVTARGLAAQPLSHVALSGIGTLRKLCCGLMAAGNQPLIQTQLIANADQRRVKCSAEIHDSLS